MTKRIFKSICLVSFLIFIALVTLIMGVVYKYFSTSQKDTLNTQTSLVAEAVNADGIDYLKKIESDTFRITWIDKSGKVLFDNKAQASSMENHLQREEVKEAIATGKGQSERFSETTLERQLYSAERLDDGSIIRLSVAQSTWWGLLLSLLQPLLIITFIALGIALFLANRLSKRIVEPLNNIDLDNIGDAKVYDELSPFVQKIASQQKQVDQAEEIRQEFTANVSHELRTPLQTIAGSSELLSEGIVDPKDVQKFSKHIYSEAKRLMALVEDIIKLSHLDEGDANATNEPVDIYEMAKMTVENLSSIASSADVTLNLEGSKAVILGKPQLISSIVFNLCDNAIKYNKAGGKVDVAVTQDDDNIILKVSDTGIGIPAEQQTRIFERFYRVDKSHSKEVGGTGLGLSIVKHAALLHNAKIDVHSILNEGTTITVTFPK